jgi:hypothetical protein
VVKKRMERKRKSGKKIREDSEIKERGERRMEKGKR